MTRSIGPRRALSVVGATLVVLAVACAEKVVAPAVVLSPRFNIQVTATAKRTPDAQKVFVAAVYFRAPQPGQSVEDSAYVLASALLDVTGGPQQVNLKVDLTSCLADPTRHGSHDACSMYIAAFLQPSTWDPDTSDYFGSSYDFQILGPYEATPGHPPTPPATLESCPPRTGSGRYYGRLCPTVRARICLRSPARRRVIRRPATGPACPLRGICPRWCNG